GWTCELSKWTKSLVSEVRESRRPGSEASPKASIATERSRARQRIETSPRERPCDERREFSHSPPACASGNCRRHLKKRGAEWIPAPRACSPIDQAAANLISTSRRSSASTWNSSAGTQLSQPATYLSGICWIRVLNVVTVSL